MNWLIQTFLWLAGLAILLFVPAGTINWPGAWIFLVETCIVGVVLGLWLARHDPALLKERLRPPIQKGQSTQDKIVTGLLLVLYLAWFAFMALDAVRFKWSSVPAWLQVPGAAGILVACYITYLTLRENTFAALVVKVQRERAQTVITTGPYAYVRHPMYAGMLIYLFCVPLLLGSWWGLLWGCVLLGLFAIRIRIEEQTLRKELPGYNEYAARVRYRLIPQVW
ncbi:MAG TPA: isoprenylcysteine carboxylmethyltransferase family protein [Chthoniobacterales bacterium]|jgi:protein-S-isoprenylcysteine O-methyltransferase Ste14|nr:isoprenylcysteine carboxylmethyltransferase family protein [Chthoniobacterales bacterium]